MPEEGQGRMLSRSRNVYKDADFRQERKNPKLHEVVAPPITK